MRCPNCHTDVATEEDYTPAPYERRVLTEEQREINRLNDKRNKLRSMRKYTKEVRDALWARKQHMTPAFSLLIAVECIWHYLKTDLNEKLRAKGLIPV